MRDPNYEEWSARVDADYRQNQIYQEEQMANIRDMVESKYLKQADVEDEALVTIEKIGKGNIAKEGDEPEYKWMARFKEFRKPLILNATNIKRLSRACNSEETSDWIGKQVVLYVDPDVEFGGNVVGGLRIKAANKKPANFPKEAGDLSDIAGDVPFN